MFFAGVKFLGQGNRQLKSDEHDPSSLFCISLKEGKSTQQFWTFSTSESTYGEV